MIMNNTILALEVLWKIAGNFIFNGTALAILILFGAGLTAFHLCNNQD
jgi:hypothetical protein